MDDFGLYDTKIIILRRFLTERLSEKAFSGDHKVFEIVCCMLINTKSRKVSVSYVQRLLSCIKRNTWGGGGEIEFLLFENQRYENLDFLKCSDSGI